MSDRQLLEDAAKAAGIELTYRRGSDAYYYDDPETGREQWNPLEKDEQALRLAVRLRLQVRIEDYGTSARPISKLPEAWVGCETHKMGGDHAAATRRAITRAAAAISSQNRGVV